MAKLNTIEQDEQPAVYRPSRQEQERIALIYNRMQDCMELRNRSYHYFDELSLEDMINESVKRANSYLPPTDNDDWHIQVNMPETEDHLHNILSFAAAQRFRSEISARSDKKLEDKELGSILHNLNEWSLDHDDGDQKFIASMQEMLTKGTVIVYEGYRYTEREVKRVDEYDPITLEVKKYTKETIIDADHPETRVVPIENIYIPNYYQPDIQKQSYIIEREELSYEYAASRFGYHPNFKHVPRKANSLLDEKEGDIYFFEQWSERTNDDSVEILHYYDKYSDTYNVVINGVLLTDVDNPIIFEHKEYPYSKAIHQSYASDFFWGKPFPMRLMARQDFLNVMYNMMGDRTFMSLMPAFITSIEDEIEEDEIGPLQRIKVSDVSQIRELNFQSVSGGDVGLMNLTAESMGRSANLQALSGAPSDATATAILQAREAATQTLGMLMKFMAWMTYRQTRQRLSNILQFFASPTEGDKKEITLRDTVLSDGRTGIKVIRLVENKKEIPTEAEIDEELLNSDGEELEIKYVTSEQLRNIDFDIEIIPNSSVAESKTLKKAMHIEGVTTMLNFFGPLMTPPMMKKLATETAELFDLAMDFDEEEGQEGLEAMLAQAQEQLPEGEVTRPELPQITEQIVGNPQDSLTQLARE